MWTVATLEPPVTPEVAGSSPVAPVSIFIAGGLGPTADESQLLRAVGGVDAVDRGKDSAELAH